MKRISLQDGAIDLDNNVVIRSTGAPIALSPIEQRLLVYLANRAGQIVDREELLTEVWGYRKGVHSRTIDSTVRRLRHKIEIDPAAPAHLRVLYGRGLIFEPHQAPPLRRSNLFVGRQEQRALLARHLGSGARLISIVGGPGAGKTRLAEEGARREGAACVWVRLGTARSTDEVLHAVMEVLGEPTAPGDLGRLLARRGPLLLVLDGCEGSAHELARSAPVWLREAQDLTLVLTSRRALGIQEEQRVPVGPMLPAEARELFSARACQVAPSLQADPEEIDRLVAALHYLPLSIELVAARTRIATVKQILGMLDRRLDLLSGDQDAARLAIDWSLSLLTQAERETLEALALFAGGFTLDDASAVLGADWVISRLEALVDHSLIWVTHGAERAQYILFDVVRERVRELCPPRQEAACRHAQWFVRWSRERYNPHTLPGLVQAVPELRAALERTAEIEPNLAARCALELLVVYLRTGPLGAAVALAPVLARLRCAPPLRALIASGLAEAYRLAGRDEEALRWTDEGLASLSSAPAPSTEARLRCQRAQILLRRSSAAQARGELDRARQLAVPDHLAMIEFITGTLHLQSGALDDALASFSAARSLAAKRPSVVASCLAAEGAFGRRLDEAELRFREALEVVGIDDERTRATILIEYAALLCRTGRLKQSKALLDKASRHCERIEDPSGIASVRALRALMAARSGRISDAIDLLGDLTEDLPLPTISSEIAAAIAEVRLLAGDEDGAAWTLARSRARAGVTSGHFRSLEILTAHAPSARAAAREEAQRFHERADRALGRAVHEAVLAIADAQDGDLASARGHLTEASRAADALGASPDSELRFWVARADTFLRSGPASVQDRDGRK